jgi:hypothetical protein
MPEQQPSVARIVHFRHRAVAGECIAAIVTAVSADGAAVSLTPFWPPSPGRFPVRLSDSELAAVRYDADRGDSSWHWPERV